MSNAIGAEGMGLYQLILPIYSLAWSITSAGFTTTISRLTAQENIRGQSGNIGRVVKQAVTLSLLLSLLVGGGLFFFAEETAQLFLKDSRAALSLRLLALAVPFMAAGSCFRGFFLGMQGTVVPASASPQSSCWQGFLSRLGWHMPAVPPSAAYCSVKCFPVLLPSPITSIISVYIKWCVGQQSAPPEYCP